jgi:hypothetical protein
MRCAPWTVTFPIFSRLSYCLLLPRSPPRYQSVLPCLVVSVKKNRDQWRFHPDSDVRVAIAVVLRALLSSYKTDDYCWDGFTLHVRVHGTVPRKIFVSDRPNHMVTFVGVGFNGNLVRKTKHCCTLNGLLSYIALHCYSANVSKKTNNAEGNRLLYIIYYLRTRYEKKKKL